MDIQKCAVRWRTNQNAYRLECFDLFNSSPPSAAYMRMRIRRQAII